ncbi:MAG TPA: efflux RND transporter permease subunit, partial [Polyangiaceae bacterium]|nr:efflux RND transporter permease subunit [Polyangiaceae bacterium]
MLSRIVHSSAARPAVALLLVSTLALAGIFSFQRLRRDVFPDLSTPLFSVIVQNASMGADELETSLAIPLETALTGLPNVRRIRSTSQLGVAQVVVEFEPDADYYRSRQLVAERVNQVAPSLPKGSEPPLLSSLTGRLNEVMELTLEAKPGAADLMTLRDFAEFDVRNRLLAVPGVAAVERLGGYLRQFQIQLDPDRMAARGVSLSEVLHALEGSSLNAAGGYVEQGPMEWNVRAVGRAESAADLGSVVVAVRGSTPVLVHDVADVREGPAPRRGIAHRLAGEVVSCRIVKQHGADTVEVAAGVRQAVADLTRNLPRGMSLRIAYDQSELVQSSLGGVGRAVLIGGGLVILVLFGLLGNFRAALIVTASIPLSMAIAGVLLDVFDVGLNAMTLGGLAIAVGLLVDASIIVVENVLHAVRSAAPEERQQAAIQAAAAVARPISFATLIVVAVFTPLFAMTGIEGRMYEPLAHAMIACMAASLVLALTLTPSLSARLLPTRSATADRDVWLIRRLKRAYEPALAWSMRHAVLVRVVSLALTVPALVLGARLGSEFMPELDERALLIQTQLPAEATLDQVDRMNHRLEDVLRGFPEVDDVVRRTGRSEHTEDPMPHTVSDVLVVLKPGSGRSTEELSEAMREAVTAVPGVRTLFTSPLGMRIDEGLGGTPADLSVRIFGPSLDKLDELAMRAQTLIADVPGLTDLRAERSTGLPQLKISLDRPMLARAGLTPGDVLRSLQIALVGERVSEVWQGQRRFDVVLRLQEDRRNDASAIRALLVDAHDGTRIPLSQLARIEQTFAPGVIRREAGSRRVTVEGATSGRDLGSVAADVRERLDAELRLPPGYFLDLGGRLEQQQRAARSLTFAIALAGIAVFLLLYIALGSFADTLVILATLPDAMVGAVVALWISGETWNVSSLVGLIGLFGIAVQNGLVLVTQTRALVKSGKPFEEA